MSISGIQKEESVLFDKEIKNIKTLFVQISVETQRRWREEAKKASASCPPGSDGRSQLALCSAGV